MTKSPHQAILKQFPGRRVLVVGDAMLDEYIWGEVNRISPEAPVPVVEIFRRSYLPGGAANTAANISGLRGEAILGGVVGNDPHAEALHNALKEEHVHSQGLMVDADRPTTVKTRVVAHNQQIVRVDYEKTSHLPEAFQDKLLAWCQKQIQTVDSCIISDYEKGVVSPRFCQKMIALAKENNKPVIVDPKGKDFHKYAGATVIKPNVQEAEQALNHRIENDNDLLKAGQQLSQLLEGTAVLLTRGAKGMSLFLDRDNVIHIPSLARHVYDVTGAGDTVVSVVAMALATGANLEESARLANYAAGLVVGKVGTATVRWDELLETQNE